jgi:hypothetical protein
MSVPSFESRREAALGDKLIDTVVMGYMVGDRFKINRPRCCFHSPISCLVDSHSATPV